MAIVFFITMSILTGIYGENLSKKIAPDSVRYSLSAPQQEYKLENTSTGEVIKYTPNVAVSGGLSLSIGPIGLGASFRQADDEENPERQKSDYFDYFIRAPYKNGILELYYGEYNGFKLEGIDNNNLLDIESTNYGIQYKHYFDKSFDVEKSTGHYALNRKSDYGTFMTLGFSKTIIRSESTLVPQGFEAKFSEYVGLRGLEQDALFALYGISGQYLIGSFYLQASVGAGINVSKAQYDGAQLDDSVKIGPATHLQLNLGQEFKHSLLGFELNATSISDQQNENQLASTRSDFIIYYRYFF